MLRFVGHGDPSDCVRRAVGDQPEGGFELAKWIWAYEELVAVCTSAVIPAMFSPFFTAASASFGAAFPAASEASATPRAATVADSRDAFTSQ